MTTRSGASWRQQNESESDTELDNEEARELPDESEDSNADNPLLRKRLRERNDAILETCYAGRKSYRWFIKVGIYLSQRCYLVCSFLKTGSIAEHMNTLIFRLQLSSISSAKPVWDEQGHLVVRMSPKLMMKIDMHVTSSIECGLTEFNFYVLSLLIGAINFSKRMRYHKSSIV